MRLKQIGAVNAGRRNLDQDFASAGLGSGNLGKHQPVIRAGIFQGDGFHGPTCKRECANAH